MLRLNCRWDQRIIDDHLVEETEEGAERTRRVKIKMIEEMRRKEVRVLITEQNQRGRRPALQIGE